MRRQLFTARRKTLVAIVGSLLVVAGCSAASPGDSRLSACVTTLFPTGTFAEFVGALEDQGASQGIEFDVQDVNNNAGRENDVLTGCATRQVDLVVASVVSPTGSLAALRRLKARGIPVICYNTCLNSPEDQELTQAFVTNDQAQLGVSTGRAAAEYIRTELGGQAKVAFLTCETYDVCKQRRQGLDEGLSEVSTTVAASQEGFVVDKAAPVATSILAAHPDVNVFIAENEDGVIAAANAIKARGLTGKAVVFGIGMNPTVGRLLLDKDRTVVATTGQDAASWAPQVIEIAEAIHAGQTIAPYNRYTPGPVFTHADPDSVQRYLADQSGR